jgi:hypothetical protein
MLNPELLQMLNKVAVSILVGATMAILLWPVRKVRKEWDNMKTEQASIHAELVQQRTNCLTTLQSQGVQQIELLGKTVAALDGVRLDLAEQTGYLKAAMVQPIRRRRTAKK